MVACGRTARILATCALVIGSIGVVEALAAVRVPWIGQKTSSECGRAVLASLAARRGGDIEAIYRRLPPPPDQSQGYSIAEMRRFGSSVGVGLSVRAPRGVVIAG